MNGLSDVALIVLNYNSSDQTIKCVDHLLSFKKDFHLVIVDNKSTDDSFVKLKDHYKEDNIDILDSGANNGYSAGNNYGIRYAIEKYGIDYFTIINPDVIIPCSGIFDKLLDTIKCNDDCAVVGASILNSEKYYNPVISAWKIPSKKDFILSRSLFWEDRLNTPPNWKFRESQSVEVECVAGCFFLGAVNILKKAGFLDEDLFMYNEEILLGYKVKQLGYKELLRLDCFVIHDHVKRPSPKICNYLSARKKRFNSDIILYKKIYSGCFGLIAMCFFESINRIVLFPWFAVKPFLHTNK